MSRVWQRRTGRRVNEDSEVRPRTIISYSVGSLIAVLRLFFVVLHSIEHVIGVSLAYRFVSSCFV